MALPNDSTNNILLGTSMIKTPNRSVDLNSSMNNVKVIAVSSMAARWAIGGFWSGGSFAVCIAESR
jgi:hypothetical protein